MSLRNKMLYAAVLTVETTVLTRSTKVNLSLVPIHWLIENILYWPPNANTEEALNAFLVLGATGSPPVDKQTWRKYAVLKKIAR